MMNTHPESYNNNKRRSLKTPTKTKTDSFTGPLPARHPEEPSQLDLTSVDTKAFASLKANTAPLPVGFRRTPYGLYVDVSGRDLGKKWKYVAAPLGISAMVKDEKGRHGCEVAYFDCDSRYTTTIVWLDPTKSPAEVRKQLKQKGLYLGTNSGRKPEPLCHFIKQSTTPNTKQVLTRNGWSRDKDAFLLGSTALGANRYLADVRSSKCEFEQEGSIEDWHEAYWPVLNKCPIAVFVVCYALAGPLWELLDLKAPAVHLHGQNAALKRFLVDLANSIFGNPDSLHLTWNMSRRAAETFRIGHNHCFVAFDDLTGTRTSDAWSIVHELANGTPRTRTDCSGKVQREDTWNLSTLSTGCYPIGRERLGARLAQQTSLYGQIVSVPVLIGFEADDLGRASEKPLETLINDRSNSLSSWPGFGTVGRACIEALIQDQAETLQAVTDERDKLLESATCEGVLHQPHDPAGLVFSVSEAVGRVFSALGYLPIDPDAVTRSVRAVERACRSNLHKTNIARHAGLLSKLSRTIRDADNNRADHGCELNPPVIIDKEGTFVGSSYFKELCRPHLSSLDHDAPEASNRILFELTELGIIVRKNSKKLTWQKRHNKHQVRVLKIDKDRLETLLNSCGHFPKSPKKNPSKSPQESRRQSLQDRIQKIRERNAQRAREVSSND